MMSALVARGTGRDLDVTRRVDGDRRKIIARPADRRAGEQRHYDRTGLGGADRGARGSSRSTSWDGTLTSYATM